MGTTYLASLGAVVVVLLAVRLAAPQPALVTRRRARLAPTDVGVLVIGVLLLALHCGSMFFRSTTNDIGLGGYASVVDRFGPASMTLYAVPAFLVVLALRRLQPLALAVIGTALGAVGITMYDGGALSSHLAAIFCAIVAIVLGVLFGTRVGARPAGRLGAA